MSQHTEKESLTSSTAIPASAPLASSMQSESNSQSASVPRSYGAIETPDVAPNNSWYEDFRKNKPQSLSLSAASMVFLSNGMSLAYSVGVSPVIDYGKHSQYCWFIAVIIGACISAVLAHKLTKFSFNLAASVLIITKGVLYIALPAHDNWTIAARYIDGIAFGLTIIPTILAGSEQSAKNVRGYVLGVEQTSLSVGALLLTIFTLSWDSTEDINRAQGYASLVYGLLALLDSYVFTIESPIFHLRNNNETEALDVLRQLQRPTTITNETRALLNENRSLLDEDLARGIANNVSNSWIPVINITILRIFVSLSFSIPLVGLFLVVQTLKNPFVEPNPFVYVLMRVIGVTISLLSIDRLGRKTMGAVVLLIGSVFLLGIGTLSNSTHNPLQTIVVFFILQQLLAGILAPASTCYMGEAYSISVKPYFILISIVVENFVQILVSAQLSLDSFNNFPTILAAFQFIYAFVYYFTLPETKGTTLREALDKFSKRVYVRFENA